MNHQAEGQPQSYSSSDLIKLDKGDSYSKQFQVTFPPTGLVPDTKHLEITLIGFETLFCNQSHRNITTASYNVIFLSYQAMSLDPL